MGLPKPIGKQREVVCLPATGQHVVLGTAGSGKTTMAIARARYLTNNLLPEAGRTLVVTYNKALANYINSFSSEIPEDVDVRNYHLFARGYLKTRGRMTESSLISVQQRANLVARAVVEVAHEENSESAFFRRSPKFFLDEIQWLNGRC